MHSSSAVRFGLTLSSEEHPPGELIEAGRRAEELGFDYCSISDHFHPWVREQGHSPFVWGVLGAVAAVTDRIELITGVTCPIIRTHPAIVAHAAATTSLIAEGRFSLGVGTGEALNEHIHGDRWPRPEVRLEMLEEAVEVLRRMWTGETCDHRGRYYEVENARLFDPPQTPLRVIVSGFGTAAVELAGRIGDGFIGHGGDDELVSRYRSAGGMGPKYAQLSLCYGPDRETAARTVLRCWPNRAIPGQLSQDLPTWTHFEQAAELVTVETVTDGLAVGPDVDEIVRQTEAYLAAGFDHVHFHQIGPDLEPFLNLWESELRDRLGTLGAASVASAH